MTTQTESMITKPSDKQIKTERVFDAPRAHVWRAFTEPALVAQWWGRGHDLDVQELNLEPGGTWRFVEHAPDEGDFAFFGKIVSVEPMDRITQTFGWEGMQGHESTETAVFEELPDGKTRVTSTSTFFDQKERDAMLEMGMSDGMEQSYRALDKLLTTIS
jgi:uncharacterized protein YndB with AHSA1/START domain